MPPSSFTHLVAALALTQVGAPGLQELSDPVQTVNVSVALDRRDPLPTESLEPPTEGEVPEIDERPVLVPQPVEPPPELPPERSLDPNLDLPDSLAALSPEPLTPRPPEVEPEPTPLAVSLPEPPPPVPPTAAQVLEPRIVDQPSPSYPLRAKRLDHEGTVELRALVARDGRVSEVITVPGSGYEELDRAARDAFGRWRFAPWIEGEPEPRTFAKAFTFSLTIP
ncbi:MAG: energy transducer TonB [Planctomycetota bacterium]|nr:energy transducer TonB [Planctomycetota bacterium]